MNYGFIKKLNLSFNEALKKVEDELKKGGFGIITKIDVKDKFKENLDIDFPRYQILGACNPEMAHKAISAEFNVGLLLPCNVIIYEKDESIWVSVIKPTQAMNMVQNDELKKIAKEVEEKLKIIFDKL
jgi:uncharacterized protein (DUF302 family)